MSDERERLASTLVATATAAAKVQNLGEFSQVQALAAAQLRADGERIKSLEEALAWCSGSPDFNDGGQAVEGWRKICAPLLKEPDHG